MLSINNLTYKVGSRTLIEDSSVNVMDGWKVGLVGQNGTGKSTLFKLIAGELHADSGTISLSQRQRFGMVRQDIEDTETPLIEMVINAHEEMSALMKATETEQDPNKLGDIYDRLIELDAYAAPSKAAILLTGLGFKDHQLTEPFSSFSGGWRMRVALAAALFVEPDFLLLDEPTNHLDLEAIMWLEGYLANYPHTLMVISHDRELLNKCIDHVIHIDKQKLVAYTGNYDTFERERAAKLGLQQKMFEKQQAQRAHMQAFVDRFRASAAKAAQAQSRIKALERMDIIDEVMAERAVRFTFPSPEKLSPPLIAIRHVDVGYTEGKPIVRKIHENIDTDDRIALLGANGNGKSTMMKLIAGKLSPMQGELVRSGKLRIGYFSQHQTEELDVNSTPFQEMARLTKQKTGDYKEHIVRAVLGAFGFSKNLADNPISSLSGGEKARLLFAFMSFDKPHLLLLDEPTNHLDMEAREALVQALNNYDGAIVIVSHDPIMVERVADRLWLVKDGACQNFNGDLDDYREFILKSRREERKEEKEKRARENAKEPVKDKPAPTMSPAAAARKAADAEKQVARLTKEKERLEALMALPEYYNDPKKIKEAKATYSGVMKDLETQEAAWLDAQEAQEQAAG
ncbi:MAG TPA: ABC-F family ATP-binding cassette domain-containing protein [Patescibacteria group bacterium]|nr:ABC-F family ATP-binding cassette domain-containing protein [Patescibacteria group bacterium]